jgi:plastocyanin
VAVVERADLLGISHRLLVLVSISSPHNIYILFLITLHLLIYPINIMLFSNLVLAALAQSLTVYAATMQVTVAANNKFQFTPNSITAQPGDIVAFNFVSQNHSVASSDPNSPCQPQANAIFSDFQPIAGDPNASPNGGNGRGNRNNRRQAGNTPQFMVPITDNAPMYIYCSQAQHCQQGMVMVINPPDATAVTNYQNLAAQQRNNVSPQGGISGGQVINDASQTNPKNVLGGNAGDAATPQTGNGGNGKNGGNGNAANGNGGGRLANLLGLGGNN